MARFSNFRRGRALGLKIYAYSVCWRGADAEYFVYGAELKDVLENVETFDLVQEKKNFQKSRMRIWISIVFSKIN